MPRCHTQVDVLDVTLGEVKIWHESNASVRIKLSNLRDFKKVVEPTELLSDDIPKQPLIFRIIAALILVVVVSLTVSLSPPSDFQVHISAKLDADATVEYRFNQQLWRDSCVVASPSLASLVRRACNNCEVEATCKQRSTKPFNPIEAKEAALLRFMGGSATFTSNSGEKALALCKVSVPSVSTPEAQATCSEITSAPMEQGATTAGVAIFPASLLLLILLLGGVTAIQRKSMGALEKMTTGHRQATSVITLLSDLLAIYCCWLCVIYGSGLDASVILDDSFNQQTLIATVILISYLHFRADHYQSRCTMHSELSHIFGAITILALLHTTLATLGGKIAPGIPAVLWASCLVTIPITRYLLRSILDDFDIWRRPALVIGRGENAIAARRALGGDFTLGYKTIRLKGASTPNTESGGYCELDNLANDVHLAGDVAPKVKIVAALDSLQSPEAQHALGSLIAMERNIEVIPSLRGLPALGASVSQFFGHELIMLSVENKLTRRTQRIFKRSFDIFVSTILLALLSPLLVYLIFRIKSDGHSAFFKQSRVGRNASAFECIKFRSMHVDAEVRLEQLLHDNEDLKTEWRRNFKLSNDPRVTAIGKTLRKYSLDELPQLLNVLRGEMSLVGPRPLLFNEVERYGDAIQVYGLVSPGITGVWQVSGRSDTSFEQRREMDEWYIRNWSIYYDMSCLIKTIGVVVGSKGAY